jgi:hypothetical protein
LEKEVEGRGEGMWKKKKEKLVLLACVASAIGN